MYTFPSLIAGQEVAGGALHKVHNPFNQTVVGAVHQASADHVERALQRGHEAERDAAALPAWRRREILQRLQQLLMLNELELATLIQQEAGKPIALARTEVRRAADTLAFAAGEVARNGELLDLGLAEPGEGRWGIVRRFPLGLISAITPFNFPLNLVVHKLAPAIAAGCPIVLKPSPLAPLSTFRLAQLALEAGLPEPMISVVMPDLLDLAPLVSDPRVKVLTFTGSAPVGWQLKAQARRQKVLLELGGNASAIVCADADLDRSVHRVAIGGFAYAGQSCISVQRVLVQQDIVEDFAAHLGAHLQTSALAGDPADEATLCGPVINAAAVQRLESWLKEARDAGASVLTGGEWNGPILQPTVLLNVPAHCKLAAEEAFGPIVCLETYNLLDEAIERVNSSRFGLQTGLFTQDIRAIWRAFERIEVGALIHDDVPTFRVDQMPYGGVKDSGLGREGPRSAIEEYTEPRVLALRV